MKKGYTEWVSENGIGFITNSFHRILYVNKDWPNGRYEKVNHPSGINWKMIKEKCRECRSFSLDELMLELL